MKEKGTHWPSYARKVRKSAAESIEKGDFPKKEVSMALSIPVPYHRAYALAGMALALHDRGMEFEDVWEDAVKSAMLVEPGWKKEEILERLVSVGYRCSADVLDLPLALEDRKLRLRLISKLIRLASENMEYLSDIWHAYREMDGGERYEILRMLAHAGLPAEKCISFGREIGKEEGISRYLKALDSPMKERNAKKGGETGVEPLRISKASLTLGLYNSYRGKADDSHYRNIARAAALCYAYDLNLALIGFPFSSPEECTERTVSRTRIGKGGKYLKELHRAGRLSVYSGIDDIEGTIVATTSHPDIEKKISAKDIRAGTVVLVGIGHYGLGDRILRKVPFHLELTGKGASLETCTAMGALACMLASIS